MSAPSPILAHWPYPRWIAHRGAGKLAPENTLAAFRLGAQYGYRMFECDAKLSADGVPFLMHDATLDRTTNGAPALGSAASAVGGDHPWAALSQLDAGAWHSRSYAGEPLPTLENIAHYCIANGFLLNIEIKPTPGTEAATGEAVARLAARMRIKGDLSAGTATMQSLAAASPVITDRTKAPTSRARSPIRPTTTTSAVVKRAIISISTDFPTPEPAMMPKRCRNSRTKPALTWHWMAVTT